LPKGFSHWTAYLRYFLWIELWPPLFAIVNMAMNFYLQQQSSAFSGSSVSMDTFSQLAQLHQSSTAIAGYVSIMVPMIARGLVSNTVLESIAGIASGLLGGLQSTANLAAGEATTGNFSLGNTNYHNASAHNISTDNASFNNVNGNKHDTDWTEFHGTYTEQMASGVMKTTTEDGNTIYNVAPGMSNLAQSVNLSSQLSSTLSHSAEQAHATAVTEANNVQSSVSSAASHFVQLGEALGNDHRENDHASLGLSDTETKALSFLDSKADEISKNEHISKADAFKEMGNMAYHGQIGANVDAKNSLAGLIAKHAIGTGGSVNVSAAYTNSDASEHSDSYTRNDTHGLTSREAEEVSQAFHVMESHQNNQSSDVSDSRAKTLIENFASDLHSARTSSHNRDVSYSQSERLSDMATTAQTNSASVNSNLNQAFVNYVRESEGEAKADALFSNPGALSSQAQLGALGSRFVNYVAQDMMQNNTAGLGSHINPEASFARQSASQGGAESVLNENNTANHDILRHKAEFQTTNGVEHDIRDNVNTHIGHAQENTTKSINQHWQAHQSEKKAMETDLEEGKHTATTWTTPLVGTWIPTDGRSNEEKLDTETKQ
jgi:conjugal transfer mating pair stabilization protein TraG